MCSTSCSTSKSEDEDEDEEVLAVGTCGRLPRATRPGPRLGPAFETHSTSSLGTTWWMCHSGSATTRGVLRVAIAKGRRGVGLKCRPQARSRASSPGEAPAGADCQNLSYLCAPRPFCQIVSYLCSARPSCQIVSLRLRLLLIVICCAFGVTAASAAPAPGPGAWLETPAPR